MSPSYVKYVGWILENAHAKMKNGIFYVWFPENWFKFDIISNAFWNSTIWAIQIQVTFAGFKNPKNPGLQPTHTMCVTTMNSTFE